MNPLKTILLLLFSGIVMHLTASPDSGDSTFVAKYKNFNFNGSFAVCVENDTVSNYYLVDFSQFKDQFERIFFMNQCFADSRIVNLGYNDKEPTVIFKAHRNYPVNEIISIFRDFKKETLTRASAWSESERTQWVQKNNKYK